MLLGLDKVSQGSLLAALAFTCASPSNNLRPSWQMFVRQGPKPPASQAAYLHAFGSSGQGTDH